MVRFAGSETVSYCTYSFARLTNGEPVLLGTREISSARNTEARGIIIYPTVAGSLSAPDQWHTCTPYRPSCVRNAKFSRIYQKIPRSGERFPTSHLSSPECSRRKTFYSHPRCPSPGDTGSEKEGRQFAIKFERLSTRGSKYLAPCAKG